MVHYFASAATFLALTSLSTTAVHAEDHPTNLRRKNEHRRLRKLYGGDISNSHFVSDTVTKCEEVMEGNPPVCIQVCVEVTSITSGETLVDETSKVTQSKCKSSNVIEEKTTGAPTNHPTYLATELVAEDDKSNIVTYTYSPDILTFSGEKKILPSSAMNWAGDGYPSTTTSDSNSIVTNGSSKSSKNGFVSSSKGGKNSFSAKSSKSEFVSSTVENVAISNGWSGSAQSTSEIESSQYRIYPENSSDVLDANGWYSSAQAVDGGSSSKSNKSGAASIGSAGSSKSSKSDGLEETVATSNGWYGSAETISSAAGSSSKSSKSDGLEETIATSNGWYGSAETISSAAGSGSKSSKSDGAENVTALNGWSGSAQTISSAAGASNKSFKLQESNGSVSSSKGGKDGDSGDANVEVVTVSNPQASHGWQSDGWQ